jgi:hypothetical protein
VSALGATVVLSATDVLQFPQGGGHFSAFLQYVEGMRANGCEVWWLERLAASGDPQADARTARELSARLDAAGLPGRLIVYAGDSDDQRAWLTVPAAEAEALLAGAELLLNFFYELDAEMLGRFRRTALIDIDPGLLQVWMAVGVLDVADHDLYFTTGDTVGTPQATFPSCGVDWIHIRPPVSVELWPFVPEEPERGFTTVSSWWSEEWASDGSGEWYANNKRVSFLEYVELPRLVRVPLELALNVEDSDGEDLAMLEQHGWLVRRAAQVTSTPAAYRSYVQGSGGEFSCAKPSCMRLQNAWVSDRTICYLASGRPAVVQNTGPSPYLDVGRGLLRFSTLEEAAEALSEVQSNYAAHCAAARELAEAHFDARKVTAEILEAALGAGDPAARSAAR